MLYIKSAFIQRSALIKWRKWSKRFFLLMIEIGCSLFNKKWEPLEIKQCVNNRYYCSIVNRVKEMFLSVKLKSYHWTFSWEWRCLWSTISHLTANSHSNHHKLNGVAQIFLSRVINKKNMMTAHLRSQYSIEYIRAFCRRFSHTNGKYEMKFPFPLKFSGQRIENGDDWWSIRISSYLPINWLFKLMAWISLLVVVLSPVILRIEFG